MCLNPLSIQRKGWEDEPIMFSNGRYMTVPCGKCIECKLNYSKIWSARCILESKLHSESCFLTLTYNDEHLPVGANLCKRDFQLFMKRFRKAISPLKIRFYGCGEYGSKFLRPHYHIIIFGYCPDDLVYLKTDKKGIKLYKSKFIADLWKNGFISVGALSKDSIKYCVKYLNLDYRNIGKDVPSFSLMSRRPGIGLQSVPDSVLSSDKIYYNGTYMKTPVCFLNKLKSESLKDYDVIKFTRFLRGLEMSQDDLNYDLIMRRKKFLKIFGDSIDNLYRPVLSFKYGRKLK